MGAKIYNSNLTKEIIDGAKIQISEGGIPSEIAEKVIPVMEVNPKLLKETTLAFYGSSTTTANATVTLTSTTKDIYITSINLNWIKNAACDATSIYLSITGATDLNLTMRLYQYVPITLTAGEQHLVIQLPNPIKIKKGVTATILMFGSFTAGSMTKSFSATGYDIDSTST